MIKVYNMHVRKFHNEVHSFVYFVYVNKNEHYRFKDFQH